jgi:phosphatidylinositol kinase/protein kinase (PI-3  family)
MIELIDSFLPHEKLGFTKYKVLAHSSEDGIMEFVSDSVTVQKII